MELGIVKECDDSGSEGDDEIVKKSTAVIHYAHEEVASDSDNL